jgi:hypothetical protein
MLNLWVDAAIIFGVVILNGLLGFIQEGKAEKALDSIRNMPSAEARTMREGEVRMISAEELVPGDVVLLESGDKVPADLRLAEAKNLRTRQQDRQNGVGDHGQGRTLQRTGRTRGLIEITPDIRCDVTVGRANST